MVKIVLENWKDGFDKVSLTKLQVNLLGKSLKESKLNVDTLLDGKEVVLTVESEYLAEHFLEQAGKIGVICKAIY